MKLPRGYLADPRDLYLDLMKKCLTDLIYQEANAGAPLVAYRPWYKLIVKFVEKRYNLRFTHIKKFNRRLRTLGHDWPLNAHTMIGMVGLNNIEFCMREILKNNIPGDCIETGVWRGGACIFMRAILKAYEATDRIVWVADSFRGFPTPNLEKYPQDAEINLHTLRCHDIPLREVKENFKVYGLLDNQVRFLKGWFKDTLAKAPIKRLALIRADADLYESTMDILVNLYPKLSPGGFIIIDDYKVVTACREAVRDFRKLHNITDKIRSIPWGGVYWQRAS